MTLVEVSVPTLHCLHGTMCRAESRCVICIHNSDVEVGTWRHAEGTGALGSGWGDAMDTPHGISDSPEVSLWQTLMHAHMYMYVVNDCALLTTWVVFTSFLRHTTSVRGHRGWVDGKQDPASLVRYCTSKRDLRCFYLPWLVCNSAQAAELPQ